MATLTLAVLRQAVEKDGAAFRFVTDYQPAGGPGDKVFPPTYEGGKYATEKRRLPGRPEPVDCVLLDSVQSQANRMELALLDAVREGGDSAISLPLITVAFAADLPKPFVVTSLDAPHRIADALLRDSLHNATPFRESDLGSALSRASLDNATPLFQYCPTALVFGLWDSTGPQGGLGAKFQRTIVSEIVGIGITPGVKTSSRIDPAQIALAAGPLFRKADDSGWTRDKQMAKHDATNPQKLVLFKKKSGKDVVWDPQAPPDAIPDQGKPSAANHGNVTPTIDVRKDKNNRAVTEDVPAFRIGDDSGLLVYSSRRSPVNIGGVTMEIARQTTVLSLPALRRLKFPVNGKTVPENNHAARTALAALAICAATLAREQGCDLRSRCFLIPTSPLKWELLGAHGSASTAYDLSDAEARTLLHDAVAAARNAGLPWQAEEIKLTPSPELIDLVRESQRLQGQALDPDADENDEE